MATARLVLYNGSRFRTGDVRRLLKRALHRVRCWRGSVIVHVFNIPKYTRGLATLGGVQWARAALCVTPRATTRSFAQLAEHELLHVMGFDHPDMTRRERWCEQ